MDATSVDSDNLSSLSVFTSRVLLILLLMITLVAIGTAIFPNPRENEEAIALASVHGCTKSIPDSFVVLQSVMAVSIVATGAE